MLKAKNLISALALVGLCGCAGPYPWPNNYNYDGCCYGSYVNAPVVWEGSCGSCHTHRHYRPCYHRHHHHRHHCHHRHHHHRYY